MDTIYIGESFMPKKFILFLIMCLTGVLSVHGIEQLHQGVEMT